MKPEEELPDAVINIIKSLGSKKRREIVDYINEHPDTVIKPMQDDLNITNITLTRQLKFLEMNGVVQEYISWDEHGNASCTFRLTGPADYLFHILRGVKDLYKRGKKTMTTKTEAISIKANNEEFEIPFGKFSIENLARLRNLIDDFIETWYSDRPDLKMVKK